MDRPFDPNPDSLNKWERFAFYAQQADDQEMVDFARTEYFRDGSEDDCYHEDAG